MNNFGFLQDLERGHLLEDLIAAQQGKEGMTHMQPMDVMPRPNPVSEWWGGVKERAGNPMGGVLDMLSQVYGYSGTPEMQQAFRQVPAALPEGLPVGMGGFPVMGGIMAGKKAATADLDMLKIAQDAEVKGMPKERIMDATGWFKGADGQWRFEIDDSAMKYHPQNMEPFDTPQGDVRIGTLGDSVEHPALFGAYPDMAGITSTHRPGYSKTLGSYQPPGPMGGESITTRMFPKKDTALHEVQHGVQQREGFGVGGSKVEFSYRPATEAINKGNEQYKLLTGDLANRLQAANASGDVFTIIRLGKENPEEYEKINGLLARLGTTDIEEAASKVLRQSGDIAKELDPYEQYKRLAGEVEARNVQTRLPLSADDRRMLYPWLTEDVPILEQLVRFR